MIYTFFWKWYIKTDPDGVEIDKTRNEHCCGKEPDPRGIEARQLKITSEA
jgi:hypothetical protein